SLVLNPTSTTEIYTLSLHDALPICFAVVGIHDFQHLHFVDAIEDVPAEVKGLQIRQHRLAVFPLAVGERLADRNHFALVEPLTEDRKSTRLNSSHVKISYAVFCLKK